MHTQTAENTQNARHTAAPRIDVYENEREWLILTDLPGATLETVNVDLNNNLLTISAKRAPEPEAKRLFRGRRISDYQRTLLVPRSIDAENISAKLNNGVLHVHLPKSEATQARKIPVRVD